MRRAVLPLVVALAAVAAREGRPAAAPGDPPARFTITIQKADDAVAVTGDERRTSFDVRSRSGIGAATITRAGDAWPKAVVVRLHLKGLERLKVSAGAVTVGAAAGVRDGKVEVRQWTPDKGETPLAPNDSRRLTVRAVGKDGTVAVRLPLDGGHFEVAVPPAFFRGNPKSLTVEWIDFYR